MRQLVHFSTAAGRQDLIVTDAILTVSRELNLRQGITGLLIAGGHRYLQVIEGSASAIEATIDRIRRDPRHLGVTVMIERPIGKRSFASWSMAYREEPRPDEFATLQQLVDQMLDHAPDPKLRDQLNCFARSFAVKPVQPVSSPWTLATHYDSDLAFNRSH